MFRLLRTLVLLLVALAVVFGVAVWYVQRNGLSARAQPTAVETAVALRLRHLAIPADQRSRKNPLTVTPQVVRDGLEHFADHCAVCHDNTGSGDTTLGRGMYPKPPDLREARTQDLSDGEIFSIIQNGVRFTGMPAFGGPGEEDHSEQDSWKIVAFIRHLPKLTGAELAAMKRLNPKGADEQDEDKPRQKPPAGAERPGHEHRHGRGGS